MRTVLRNNDEVMHYWANQVQESGRSGNVFFERDKVYSYGKHFCIARILPGNVVAFTTRAYSPSTGSHMGAARSAAGHHTVVFCCDPADGARRNMEQARREVSDYLTAAQRPRIHKATRVRCRANALGQAQQANAYLLALPEDERRGADFIDTTSLEAVEQELTALRAAEQKLREERLAARMGELLESLAKWRKHAVLWSTGLHALPAALRLSQGGGEVQTSHGASIPVEDAVSLWPVIQRVMRGDKDYVPGTPIGVYKLTKILCDGSIKVGCHDIAYAEIEAIATQLGLHQVQVA